MKIVRLALVASLLMGTVGLTATAAQARHWGHGHHRVCTWHHHHRHCWWR